MTYKDMTTKNLKNLYQAYDEQIYKIECYGVRDMLALSAIGKELEARGVTIGSEVTFNS